MHIDDTKDEVPCPKVVIAYNDVTGGFHTVQVNKRNRPAKTFRIALARQLIEGYSSRRPANFQAKECVFPDNVRLDSVRNHLKRWFPTVDYVGNIAERGKKWIRCMCAECDVPLCIAICFSSFNKFNFRVGKYFSNPNI
ncbi:hypothetical protein TNCV_2293911 [Trichonephila clavipes]|nr:hypothetical protein TNCV_2293911 [Trichonephila clavipes]